MTQVEHEGLTMPNVGQYVAIRPRQWFVQQGYDMETDDHVRYAGLYVQVEEVKHHDHKTYYHLEGTGMLWERHEFIFPYPLDRKDK